MCSCLLYAGCQDCVEIKDDCGVKVSIPSVFLYHMLNLQPLKNSCSLNKILKFSFIGISHINIQFHILVHNALFFLS